MTHGKAVVTESYSQPNNKNNHNHGPSFYTFKQKDFWFKALIVKAVNDNPTLNNREVGCRDVSSYEIQPTTSLAEKTVRPFLSPKVVVSTKPVNNTSPFSTKMDNLSTKPVR